MTRPTSGRRGRGKLLKGQPALVDVDQPTVWREGRLLFSRVPGDGRGGMDGTGGQQQQRDLGCLPGTTEGKTSRATLQVIWDNAPAHRGEAVRESLRTPDLTCGW